MILVIDKKNSTVDYASGCLVVNQPGKERRRAPVNQLEMLVVHGSAMIATGVWRALATAGVPAVLFPNRGQQSHAMLGAGLATQLPGRRMQHRCADNTADAAALAAWIVDQKLDSYRIPLGRLRQSLNQQGKKQCEDFSRTVGAAREALGRADDVAAVMGQEGYVARAWFGLLAERLPAQWKFSGRNRRPPRDPVNALLSLGYTLLHGEIRQVVIANGLDPALGFLHQDYPGREGMVLDLCEPFRAGVDMLVIDLILREAFRPQDFYYREKEGCRLSKAARPLFYQFWAEHRETWPRAEGVVPAPLRQAAGGIVQQFRAAMTERKAGHV